MKRLAMMFAFVGALACAGERDAYDGEMQDTEMMPPPAFEQDTMRRSDTLMMRDTTMMMGDTAPTP